MKRDPQCCISDDDPPHVVITYSRYNPPLPTPNAQLNQWEEPGLSYTNNASHFNANDENDAVGALLQIANPNGGHNN
jgi:hypothetical protein